VPGVACPEGRVATRSLVQSTYSRCVKVCSGDATKVIGMAVGGRSWFGLWKSAECFGMTRVSGCGSGRIGW
jgi:hypothetical protein